jgi:hypothetical protein
MSQASLDEEKFNLEIRKFLKIVGSRPSGRSSGRCAKRLRPGALGRERLWLRSADARAGVSELVISER